MELVRSLFVDGFFSQHWHKWNIIKYWYICDRNWEFWSCNIRRKEFPLKHWTHSRRNTCCLCINHLAVRNNPCLWDRTVVVYGTYSSFRRILSRVEMPFWVKLLYRYRFWCRWWRCGTICDQFYEVDIKNKPLWTRCNYEWWLLHNTRRS